MDTVRAVEMRYVIQTAIVHTAEKNYKRTLPIWWQNNILHVMSLLEQWGYFIISKSCNNLIAINIVSCHLLSTSYYDVDFLIILKSWDKGSNNSSLFRTFAFQFNKIYLIQVQQTK